MQNMLACLEHVKDDTNQGCSGQGTQYPKAWAVREGISLSEFIKRKLEVYGGAPKYAEVVGADAANEADPGGSACRASVA